MSPRPSRHIAVQTPIHNRCEALCLLTRLFGRDQFVWMELDLNREVFIYNIYPFRHMDADGEIRYRPIIRWSKLPMEIWYNEIPTEGSFKIIKKIKKHEL